MLEIKDLHVNYGAVHALNGVSMTVKDGEIVSLIGANGAGKTTTLRTITGLEKAASGSIVFDGHDLRKTEPSKIITLKLAHVPEGRHIFPQMTVEENLGEDMPPLRHVRQLQRDDLTRLGFVQVVSVKGDRTARRLFQPGNCAQRRCFSCAVRADQRNDLPVLYRHGNAVQRVNRAVVYVQVLNFKHWRPPPVHPCPDTPQ